MTIPGNESIWTDTPDGKHIVSKCGLYCDTCPAFIHGLCAGCPKLSLDDCVVKACAHRKEIATCHDCTRSSCYHFEAYYERRQMMRRRIKRLMGKQRAMDYARGDVPAKGGCSTGGGCGSGGGCGTSSGCGPAANAKTAPDGIGGGCSAIGNIINRLEALS